jgi:hypothetical protein
VLALLMHHQSNTSVVRLSAVKPYSNIGWAGGQCGSIAEAPPVEHQRGAAVCREAVKQHRVGRRAVC